MLIPNHPDDERLSALASHDVDATGDTRLTAHVASCIRCTELVDELGALRLALADLPDLRPSRPLQLVPPVEADHAADRLGGWARRFFAPVLVSGAALVLVGVVGTAGPAFSGMASSGAAPQEAAIANSAAAARDIATASEPAASEAPEAAAPQSDRVSPGTAQGFTDGSHESLAADASDRVGTRGSGGGLAAPDPDPGDEAGQEESARTLLESSRSPWPMVLFAGAALIVAALLMRWIFAPRSA